MANNKNSYALNKAGKNGMANGMFDNTKGWKDLTDYRLMRGVPDFGSLVQFNPYLSGYACFLVCKVPKFIDKICNDGKHPHYKSLLDNWKHIVEFEFKNFSGIDNITAETIQLGDDLNNINVISRVNMQSASEFSLTYDEKSGSPLTKFAKFYLTGLNDPRTQVKTYHGLIYREEDGLTPGFEKEVFTLLFINTDNTMRKVEAAYLIIAAQLMQADTEMYNYTRGDISKKEVEVKFSGYPIQSKEIDRAAQELLDFLLSTDAGREQIIVNSINYDYTGLGAIQDKANELGKVKDAKRTPDLKLVSDPVEYEAGDVL